MDAEERLEQLVRRRKDLRNRIAEQRKILRELDSSGRESSDIASDMDQNNKNILIYGGRILFSQCPQGNKLIMPTLRSDRCVLISALSEGKHSYLYFSRFWRKELLTSDDIAAMVSVRIAADSVHGNFRPLAVFFDGDKQKISHAFFTPNVPCGLRIPDGCAYIRLGVRAEGPGEISLTELRFGEKNLYELCDVDFLGRVLPDISRVPESNGNRYYEKYPSKAAIIADEFLYHAFRDAADLIYITPDNYQDVAEQADFLLLVSAWHGLNHKWDRMENPESPAGQCVIRVIQTFHEKDKPVIFYSKEDPPNYKNFVWIARRCDAVFTSAEEMIPRYREDTGIEAVNALCFSVNPRLHNPVGMRSPGMCEGVIFSGSWMSKYPERCKALRALLDGVLAAKLPLKIIDRNFSNFSNGDPRRFFPEKYYPYISPAIPHETLQKVHKLYKWAININSVTDSHTMFASRVYELQAAGNLLLSNNSLGMREKFDGVLIPQNETETADILRGMGEDEIYRRQIAGIRRVMTGETIFDRFAQIISVIRPCAVINRRIAVIVPERGEKSDADFAAQTYQNKFMLSESDCSEEALAGADIVAFWNPALQYGPHYLEDMANGFKYTACDYITKDAYSENGALRVGIEHDYIHICRDKYASVFWKPAFSWDALRQIRNGQDLPNGYSIDHFELSAY